MVLIFTILIPLSKYNIICTNNGQKVASKCAILISKNMAKPVKSFAIYKLIGFQINT